MRRPLDRRSLRVRADARKHAREIIVPVSGVVRQVPDYFRKNVIIRESHGACFSHGIGNFFKG
jgi:hypothetical protein